VKPFRQRRMRLKFQVGHSPHLEASVCFRCTAPWSAQKRAQGETESLPVRLHNHGTGARKCGEDRGGPDCLCRLAGRTVSPRTISIWIGKRAAPSGRLPHTPTIRSLVCSSEMRPLPFLDPGAFVGTDSTKCPQLPSGPSSAPNGKFAATF
jgi:hypothetical protein